MSTPYEATSPTSTFKALSYAERIRKGQHASEQDAEKSDKGAASSTNGVTKSWDTADMSSERPATGRNASEKGSTSRDENYKEGDTSQWQEVAARSKKEPRADKGKGAMELRTLNGKREMTASRSKSSAELGCAAASGRKDNSALEAAPRGAARTVWRSLATSTVPSMPVDEAESLQDASGTTKDPSSSQSMSKDGLDNTPPAESPKASDVSLPDVTPPESVRPPVVNIWQARKEKMLGSRPVNAAASSSSSVSMTPGAISKSASKGLAKFSTPSANASPKKATADSKASTKVGGKNAKNGGEFKSAVPLPNLADSTAWPDVALAAVGSKAANAGSSNRPSAQPVNDTDETTTHGTVAKRTKWTPIPAAEMQEALDRVQRQKKAEQAAESKSRKASSTATVEGNGKASSPAAAGSKKASAGTGSVKPSRSSSVSAGQEMSKKAKAAAAKNERSNQDATINKLVEPALKKAGEVALNLTETPSMISTGQKPEAQREPEHNAVATTNVPSTPKVLSDGLLPDASPPSRQKGSGVDRERGKTHPSGTTSTNKAQIVPPQQEINSVAGTSTQNQNHLRPANANGQSRGGRGGRGARGSRGGSSQGGLGRSQSEQHSPLMSPPTGRSPSLPNHNIAQGFGRRATEGQTSPGSAVYSYAQPYYGSPYHYPIITGGFVPPADGNLEAYGQANYGGGAAPFPRPVTQIAGLDTLRSFILGQLEYYFSMQNLAMDFFLRQQMDNQGWVDISMISSFNRIKSLTADADTVKEVAGMSTILEMCDQNIRLAHEQWRQWVLPDARPSAIGSDGETSAPYTGEMPFGMPGGDLSSQARDKLVGDIHRDVMRSTPSHLQAASGLTNSVPGGLEAESAASQTTTTDEAHATKTNTPATSVSGDPDPHDKLEIIL